jgi:hypothetical protein
MTIGPLKPASGSWAWALADGLGLTEADARGLGEAEALGLGEAEAQTQSASSGQVELTQRLVPETD